MAIEEKEMILKTIFGPGNLVALSRDSLPERRVSRISRRGSHSIKSRVLSRETLEDITEDVELCFNDSTVNMIEFLEFLLMRSPKYNKRRSSVVHGIKRVGISHVEIIISDDDILNVQFDEHIEVIPKGLRITPPGKKTDQN